MSTHVDGMKAREMEKSSSKRCALARRNFVVQISVFHRHLYPVLRLGPCMRTPLPDEREESIDR
jgi:hypothetical protein